MPPNFRINKCVSFSKSQIRHAVTSKKGRRYGVRERRFALATYYHSPKAYCFLSKLFHLPSISSINSWLRKIVITFGLSEHTLAVLKSKSKVLPKEETLVWHCI
ncbi:MAG: hypothetical protein GY777_15175 [Candidatus Brocadiaceae bacterium]|nr:hypothetical protein [Candidatus Brocadiaceae bacterium]